MPANKNGHRKKLVLKDFKKEIGKDSVREQ